MKTRAETVLEQIDPLSLCRSAVPAELLELRAGGKAGPDRRELLRQLRAGEPVELEIDIIATREPIKPRPLPERLIKLANANFSRFYLPQFEAFGRSFSKRPFLRDHSSKSSDRGGRILKSEAALKDDVWLLLQTVRVVKPWAVEDVLDGSMETFSIGWRPKRSGWAGFKLSAYCTVCDGPMFGAPPVGQAPCLHWPGDVVKPASSDERVIVELEWRSVVGKETSEVTFPAVEGTKVEDVVAALSALREAGITRAEVDSMDPRLLQALGLTNEATVDEAVTRATALSASADRVPGLELELAAAQETARTATATLEVERAAQQAARAEAERAELAALREDALSRGLFVEGDKRAELFDRLAESSVGRAREFVEALSPVIPVGRGELQSERGRAGDKRGGRGLSERERRFCKDRGMSEEEFLRYQQDDPAEAGDDDDAAE